jgi:predicted PurR-regulated permease PerM
VLTSLLMYFGRTILIPLSFAVLVSFVLYPVSAWMERKGLGKLASIFVSITLLVLIGGLIVFLMIKQVMLFIDEWPVLRVKIMASIDQLSNFLINVWGVSKDLQDRVVLEIRNQSGGGIVQFLRMAISLSSSSAILLVLVPVYSVLILYYRSYWMEIVHRLFPGERKENLKEIVMLTIQAYYRFIKGMGMVYLIVGTLNSIGLLALGVPHAILFGFIASVLTFVPYFGIIAGSLLPIAMAWITYDSVWYPIGIIGIFSFVQYLEANIIFPLAVSRRLNVNALVMLLSIFAGGLLWGLAGMILFVPFVGIAKLIADHNPKWKTMSMILGSGK